MNFTNLSDIKCVTDKYEMNYYDSSRFLWERVQLIGFGTFEAKTRATRTGKNPRTGEAIKIAESKVLAFKAGAAFKDLLNK